MTRRLALALSLALSLSGCQPDRLGELQIFGGPQPARQIDRVALTPEPLAASPEKRRADLNTVLTGAKGLMEEPELEAYANTVLSRLMAVSPRKAPDARVYLLADASPAAFAYPSGAIFISQGLMQQLESEDALAFVLAHELGHVLMEHGTSDAMLKLQRYGLMLAETSVGLAQKNGGSQQGVPGWLLASYAGTIVSRDLLVPSRTRSQEDDCDRFGVDLIAAAKYNVEGAAAVVKLLYSAEQEYGVADQHADSTLLEDALRQGWDESQQSSNKDNILAKGLDQLFTDIGNSQRDWRRNHRTPEDRLKELNAYLDREHTDDGPDLSVEPLRATMARPAIKGRIDDYAAANALAKGVIELRGSKLATRERVKREKELAGAFKHLSSQRTGDDSYIRVKVGEAFFAMGRSKDWLNELEVARKGTMPSLIVYSQLAMGYENSGRRDKALEVLQEALDRFNEPPSLIPKLIRLYRASGQTDKARFLALRCRLVAPEMSNHCAREAG